MPRWALAHSGPLPLCILAWAALSMTPSGLRVPKQRTAPTPQPYLHCQVAPGSGCLKSAQSTQTHQLLLGFSKGWVLRVEGFLLLQGASLDHFWLALHSWASQKTRFLFYLPEAPLE